VALSWDCDGQGSCYDPGTGQGTYASLSACQNNCVATSWDCSGQGNCYDPGTGQGSYSTLLSCQNNCVATSWDCDDFGNCFDPATGNGQYSSITDCELVCIDLSSNELSVKGFSLYPNPTKFECTVSANNIIEQVRLFDVSTRLCLFEFPNKRLKVLDVSKLAKGIYVIEVLTNKAIFKKKLIIE
jgi:hypothetical protein